MEQDLKRLISRINSARIKPLEIIAKDIHYPDFNKFTECFAQEIALQKIQAQKNITCIDLSKTSKKKTNLSYLIYNGKEFYFVQIDSQNITKPNKQASKIRREIREFEKKFKIESKGILYFTPFLMNGKKIRKVLQQEISPAFINLRYGKKVLERMAQEQDMNYQSPLIANLQYCQEDVDRCEEKEKVDILHYCSYEHHPKFMDKLQKKCRRCQDHQKFVKAKNVYI
jgi:hypothetical protein